MWSSDFEASSGTAEGESAGVAARMNAQDISSMSAPSGLQLPPIVVASLADREAATRLAKAYVERLLQYPIDPFWSDVHCWRDDQTRQWVVSGKIDCPDPGSQGLYTLRMNPRSTEWPQPFCAIVFTAHQHNGLRYAYVGRGPGAGIANYENSVPPSLVRQAVNVRDRTELVVNVLRRYLLQQDVPDHAKVDISSKISAFAATLKPPLDSPPWSNDDLRRFGLIGE